MSNGADTRLRRTRARIIDAAEEVFPEHGFLGASMDAVAERASVSKQTVYAHFNNKEALFLEVVQSMTAEAASEIGEDRGDSEVFSEPSARICLTDIALDQLRVVLTPRLMRLRRMIIGEVDRFPMLGKSLHETGPQRSIQRLTRAISHYSATGALNASDPEKAAVQFNWIVMGAPLNSAMLLGDAGIPKDVALREHAEEAVGFFLGVYGGKTSAIGPK